MTALQHTHMRCSYRQLLATTDYDDRWLARTRHFETDTLAHMRTAAQRRAQCLAISTGPHSETSAASSGSPEALPCQPAHHACKGRTWSGAAAAAPRRPRRCCLRRCWGWRWWLLCWEVLPSPVPLPGVMTGETTGIPAEVRPVEHVAGAHESHPLRLGLLRAERTRHLRQCQMVNMIASNCRWSHSSGRKLVSHAFETADKAMHGAHAAQAAR